jgi:leucyl aminopeptidase
MNLVLAVSQGSQYEPKILIIKIGKNPKKAI